jgi:hypothetical protein
MGLDTGFRSGPLPGGPPIEISMCGPSSFTEPTLLRRVSRQLGSAWEECAEFLGLRKRFEIGTGFKRSRVQLACRRALCHQMAAAEAGAGEVIHARHAGSVRARSACFINTLSGYCSATSDCGVIGDPTLPDGECCSKPAVEPAWIGPRRAKQLQPQCNPMRPSGARHRGHGRLQSVACLLLPRPLVCCRDRLEQ